MTEQELAEARALIQELRATLRSAQVAVDDLIDLKARFETVQPQPGPPGPQGEKGERGEKGEKGEDADIESFEQRFARLESEAAERLTALTADARAAVNRLEEQAAQHLAAQGRLRKDVLNES